MSDDPFGDLDSALDDDPGPVEAEATESDVSDVNEETEPREEEETLGPAFDYDDVKQRPLYARESSWDAFEDALALEVERILRKHDVRDAPKRELHDAALRVLAEHPDEIATALLEERGITPDNVSE